jgi:glutamate dehydrogenase
MTESGRLAAFDRLAAATGNLMSDVLRTAAGQVTPHRMISNLGKGVSTLAKSSEKLLAQGARHQSRALERSLIDDEVPPALAAKVTTMFDLDGSVGLAHLASETGIGAVPMTRAFSELGERLGLDWAQSTAAMMSPSDVWERLLVDGLARDFQQMRLELLRRLSKRKNAKADMPKMVSKWAESNTGAVEQFRTMVERAQTHAQVTPAMLAQIASNARNLLAR